MSQIPKSVAALFPPHEERERVRANLLGALDAAHARMARGPVTPDFDLDTFRSELAAFTFAEPHALEDALAWTIAQLEHGLVHITHPRYFGLFNPGPTFPAQCGDIVTAEFNPQLATFTTSPAAVEIEAHVIRAVGRRAGFEQPIGHFATGGAEANFTAVLCSLTQAHSGFASEGARAFTGQPTFYVSRESHLAWIKIAHQAGIGRSGVRLVPTDGTGRMDAGELAAMIEADRASCAVPFMIAATAGTTNAGMIDPIGPCRDLARKHGLWFHVDAAWGGGAIASDKLRPLLAGMESADSITIDAHKWFATTMGCAMFLCAHPEVPFSVFNVSTGFMPSTIPHIDPYVTTVQWSRRFFGLRLFLSLAAAGWQGYAVHVERAVGLIDLLKKALAEKGWTIANDSSLGVLCLDPPAGGPTASAIAKAVLASGNAWIAAAMFEGREVIRACVTHGESTEADIRALAQALNTAASA